MTERPILFSAPMVRALLDGTKTQTRRVVKPQPTKLGDRTMFGGAMVLDETTLRTVFCPFGAPGDRLWVRETWAPCESARLKGHIHYAADGAVGREITTNGGDRWWSRSGHTLGITTGQPEGVWVGKPSKWRPSIHMPRWASRLTLEVTGVRVERLCAISEADARAEGVELVATHNYGSDWRAYGGGPNEVVGDASTSFLSLWSSINGPGSTQANPWVWAINFKRVTP